MTSSRDRLPRRIVEGIRRAFAEFLTVPLIVVVAFILLAVAVHVVDADAGRTATWGPIWRLLARYVGDASSSNSLLGTIAGSVITVTSITFSILLLAVQQGASALTSQIVDNYLRRKVNQFYFGFFVGTSIYALVTLSLSSPSVRPVLGVTLAMIFSITALLSLVLLIYSTIDQTRPVTIINQIRDATLRARDAQNAWLPRTAAPSIASGYPIVSQTSGYLARVLLARLEALLRDRPGVRIDIGLPVGDYVPCGAALAFVTTPVPPDDGLARAIRAALPVEQQRDIACDAGFGIDQMETIAWTAISTAKSNPAAGVIACHALEDVLFRWSTAHDDRLAAGAGQAISYPTACPTSC